MDPINQYPILNPSTLAMLRRSTINKPEFLKELFQSFMDDSRELIDELGKNLGDDQFENYYTSVHTLKGLCGTIGCTRMFEVLKTMDSLNKEKNFQESKSFLNALENTYADTCITINKEVLNN
jgi:HPt (histidine-containing phosphotransfer) domain-containing protein